MGTVSRVAIEVVAFGTAQYPASLTDLRNPPDQLYAIGNVSLLEKRLVSIVGTRNANP